MSRPCELPPDVLPRRHWILRVCCLPAATPFIVIPLVRKFPQATLDKGAWSVHAVESAGDRGTSATGVEGPGYSELSAGA